MNEVEVGRQAIVKRAIPASLLLVATVVVFAFEWLAFLWPVMGLVDAGVAYDWRRKHRLRRG